MTDCTCTYGTVLHRKCLVVPCFSQQKSQNQCYLNRRTVMLYNKLDIVYWIHAACQKNCGENTYTGAKLFYFIFHKYKMKITGQSVNCTMHISYISPRCESPNTILMLHHLSDHSCCFHIDSLSLKTFIFISIYIYVSSHPISVYIRHTI